MVHYANPPILLNEVINDLDAVKKLVERNAPYTPLGGWFRPDNIGGEAMSPMWFQKDWVHADFASEGSELFLEHKRIIQAAQEFYNAEIVEPHTIYANMFTSIAESGPAHTDNPYFRGRDRTNTPMMLLRAMFWSGLFDPWLITQATSIWWLNDVEGGGLKYWPNGPDSPPESHVGTMRNTALVGDNHGMFHQVEPVGPFDAGTRKVSATAELAPANDASGDWEVTHHGQVQYRAPFQQFRVSVLWKADIYANDEERQRSKKNSLPLNEVVRIFNDDLKDRGANLHFGLDRIEDPTLPAELAAFYPEPVPIDAGLSIFDADL